MTSGSRLAAAEQCDGLGFVRDHVLAEFRIRVQDAHRWR